MRLSIVIPVLNEAAGGAEALQPLQALRGRGHEVILVDGGSHDGTCDALRPLADRVLIAERGRSSQMNAGARAASGEALVFLHADTRLPEGADALIAIALGDPARLWGRFDVRIGGRLRGLALVAAMMNLRSRLTGIATGDQAIFVRRAVFTRLGGFPRVPLMEDVELSKRLKGLARPACVSTPVLTSGRRWEAEGLVRTVVLMWGLRLAYFLGVSPDRLAKLYHRKRSPA